MSEEKKTEQAPQEQQPADQQKAEAEKAELKAKQRRESPRARCSFKARCITTQKREVMGRVTNISVGGVQVQLPNKIQPKDKLYMEIHYYHAGIKGVIKAVGESVHAHLLASQQEFDTGIKFATKLQEKDIELIKKYVKDALTR